MLPSPMPDKWRLWQLFVMASVYGLYLTASTVVLFILASQENSLFVQAGIMDANVNVGCT